MPGQTIGVCGGSGWRQPAGSQQMGKRNIGPVYLEPDRTGKAVRSVSGGASGGAIKTFCSSLLKKRRRCCFRQTPVFFCFLKLFIASTGSVTKIGQGTKRI